MALSSLLLPATLTAILSLSTSAFLIPGVRTTYSTHIYASCAHISHRRATPARYHTFNDREHVRGMLRGVPGRNGQSALAGTGNGFIDTTLVGEEPRGKGKGTDFERQELRVIFETMDNNNIFYKTLDTPQIDEILALVQALLEGGSPMDVKELYKGEAMKGRWKLEFSTEERYNLLPPIADIYNYLYDGKEGGRMDTLITFYKSWILKSVRAITTCKMDSRGTLIYEFEKVVVDLNLFKLPIDLRGPRGDRSTGAGFIEVQYFDGDLWIEVFEEKDKNGNNKPALNIYRRVGDATEKDKTFVKERKGERGQPRE
ncbi:unnamed protein product [Discosporangium mesarthrocarpum]